MKRQYEWATDPVPSISEVIDWIEKSLSVSKLRSAVESSTREGDTIVLHIPNPAFDMDDDDSIPYINFEVSVKIASEMIE